MTQARYMLAKYIPDLLRVEPRNVGVILWSPAGVVAQFLAEKSSKPGEVDGRRIPSFISSHAAYRQWVQYWRTELRQNEIESPSRPARKANRSSPEYLDVLADSNKGNFVLTEGGQLLDQVTDPHDALKYLFSNLVENPASEETRDPTLDDVCSDLIESLKLRDDPNFKSGFEVSCELPGGVVEPLEFSYAYKNGLLHRLYQLVPLTAKRGTIRKYVHDAAWMFEQVTKAKFVEKKDAVSVVYLPADARAESDADRWLPVLSTVSRVLNVANKDEAEQEFRSLPALHA